MHPFLFSGAHVALAHNGILRDFGRMRYGLLEFIKPELAQRIEGTTDSEWLYALGRPPDRPVFDAATPLGELPGAARQRVAAGHVFTQRWPWPAGPSSRPRA